MKLRLALALGLLACASAARLDFSGGLDGWTHSDDSKYSGRFVLDTPVEGLGSKALKVRAAACDSIRSNSP